MEEHQQVESSPLEGPEASRQEERTSRGAPRRLRAPRSRTQAPFRLRDERALEKNPDPVPGPRERDLVAAGNEQRSLDTCHARLAVEVRIKDGKCGAPWRAERPRDAASKCYCRLPLAGAHGHEMTHVCEPVGYAGALLATCSSSRAPSADDVVVALHVATSLPSPHRHRR